MKEFVHARWIDQPWFVRVILSFDEENWTVERFLIAAERLGAMQKRFVDETPSSMYHCDLLTFAIYHQKWELASALISRRLIDCAKSFVRCVFKVGFREFSMPVLYFACERRAPYELVEQLILSGCAVRGCFFTSTLRTFTSQVTVMETFGRDEDYGKLLHRYLGWSAIDGESLIGSC